MCLLLDLNRSWIRPHNFWRYRLQIRAYAYIYVGLHVYCNGSDDNDNRGEDGGDDDAGEDDENGGYNDDDDDGGDGERRTALLSVEQVNVASCRIDQNGDTELFDMTDAPRET